MMKLIKERITEPRKIKCEETSESRQRRKIRVEQAKRKFQEEDGCNDNELINDYFG
jgi:hypothetical protein